MNREWTHVDGKKPYEMPKLTAISLRPEEAVLGHCKTPSGGSSGSVCNNFLAPCVQTFGS